MLSARQAKQLISDLKEREISLGRQLEIWFTYENHIMGVATVAKTIAFKIPDMNVDEIYISALLHDICRTEESREQRFHGILGYEKLKDIDEKSARSALLHMFPWNMVLNELSEWDSLAVMCTVSLFSDSLNIDFDDLKEIKTIKDLLNKAGL